MQGNVVILLLRLSELFGATLAVGFVGLLARRLSGFPGRGLAAGLLAANQYLGGVTSFGQTDGMGFAALTGLVWARTTVACERRFDRRWTAIVAVLAVACGFMRLTVLIAAAAVVAAGLLVTAYRTRSVPSRSALVIAASVVVACAWFYLWIWARYGDPGASSVLLERFGFTRRGSLIDGVLDREMWERIGRTILAGRGDPGPFAGVNPIPMRASTAAIVTVCAEVVVLLDTTFHRSPATPEVLDRPQVRPRDMASPPGGFCSPPPSRPTW